MKTRTDHIREYLKSAKPSDRGPTAVSKALKRKGIVVTVHHVGMVKLGMGLTKRTKKPKAEKFNLKSVSLAKKFLRACDGDISLAKTNLDLISRLMG